MSPKKRRELHYRDKHRFADADLHNPILDAGDDATAQRVSDRVAREIGLTDAEIGALRGGSATEKK
jgi:hypothetical protein